MRFPFHGQLVADVQCIIASQHRAKSIDDTLGQTMKRVAIKSTCVIRPTSPKYTVAQVIARIHLEGNGQYSLGVAASTGRQQKICPLRQ
ncbi:hypothetical protein D3C77_506120 [compost metagenome]